MQGWILKIEVDGEWEECRFTTRQEALAAFAAVAADYDTNLRRAILLPAHVEADFLRTLSTQQVNSRYVN